MTPEKASNLKNQEDNKQRRPLIKFVYEDRQPDTLNYAHEKLGAAVWKLATGVKEIKVRLADAFVELAILQESDFPLVSLRQERCCE